jgi:hypothetical protein
MVRPTVLLLGLVLILTATGCGTTRWAKNGADQPTVKADLANCRAQADKLFAQDLNIESDILASRSLDWQRAGTLGTRRSSMDAADRGRSQSYVEDCMRALGYTPAS